MSLFVKIKSQLSLPEVVKMYGIKVTNKNKALCPFHDDTHPSLSFKNNFFKCFACGKSGSIIDFVMSYFNLTAFEAAQKLNDDFNMRLIDTNLTPIQKKIVHHFHVEHKAIRAIIEVFEIWKKDTEKWFLNVFKIFKKIFINFSPQNFENPHKIWVIAANYLEHISFVLDIFLENNREELLKKYATIESLKHKISQELEVF